MRKHVGQRLTYLQVLGIALRRQDGWDIWLGFGRMNTKKSEKSHNHMIEPEQQRVLNTLNSLLQNSREKERTMTKPNVPKLALPSLEEELNKTKESIND